MKKQAKKNVYISYSRRSEYSFIDQLMSAAKEQSEFNSVILDEKNKCRAGPVLDQEKVNTPFSLLYDENALLPGNSISAFMEKLSEGDQIIILISSGYFQSPFCMTELTSIYHKRSDELLPIVVFVDDYKPSEAVPDKIIGFWREQSGSEASKDLYESFIEVIPLVLAWLLGSWNEALKTYDQLAHIFFIKDQGDKETAADVISRLVKDLENENKPRFRHLSRKKREYMIKSRVEKTLRLLEVEPELKEKLDPISKIYVEIENNEEICPFSSTKLERLFQENFLRHCLQALFNWLKEVKDNEFSHKKFCRRVAGNAKELLGWLLMSVFDDKKLHILIHELNRKGDDAQLELTGNPVCGVQMLVSTIAQNSAKYKYRPDEDTPLKGEGELSLTDQGASCGNYQASFSNEQDWLGVHKELYKNIKEKPFVLDDDELEGAMMSIFEDRKDLYLLWNSSSFIEFRTDLGKKYPDIQQVVLDNKEKSNALTVKSYYRDGLNDGLHSGYIEERVRDIYQLIHGISDET